MMFQKMTLHVLSHNVLDSFNCTVADESGEILRVMFLDVFARRLSLVKAGFVDLPFSLMKQTTRKKCRDTSGT